MKVTTTGNAEVRRPLAWICLWSGGVCWLLHFLALWLLGEFGCQSGWGVPGPMEISRVAWLALAVTAVALPGAGIAAWMSWKLRPSDSVGHFVRSCGMAANSIFCLFIVGQTIPVFFHLKHCGGAIG